MNAYHLQVNRRAVPCALFVALLAAAASAQNQNPTTATAAQDETPDVEVVILSPFIVDSSKDVGYKATNSISATRTNTPIAEVPMNIQVVTSELLDDLAVTSATQALRFFGSVGPVDAGTTSRFGLGVDLDGAEQMFGSVRLRGLTVNEGLRNGIRAYSQLPAEFIDRVELVRGPAAVLYGLSEPTGIYNAITKSPVLGRDFGEIKASLGNYSNYGGSLDVNRTLGDNLAFRFLASAHHFDSEFVDNEGYTYYVMPQAVWRPLPETTLKVEYTYGYSKRALPDQRYVYPQNWTVPSHPTVVPGMIIPIYEDARYDIDPRFSFAGPDAFREIYDRNLVFTLTQQFGENFSVNLQGSAYRRPLEVDNANVALIPGAVNPNVAAGNSTFWSDQQTTPQDAFVLRRWQDDFNTQKVDAWVATAVYKRDFELPAIGRTTQSLTFGATGFREKTSHREATDQRDLRARDAAGNVIVSPFAPPNVTNALVRANYPTLNGGLWDSRFPARPAPGVWFDYVPFTMDRSVLDRDGVELTLLPDGVGGFAAFGGGAYTDSKYTSFWASWNGKFLEDRLILTGGVFRTSIDQESGRTLADLAPFYDQSATMPQFGAIVRPFSGDFGTVGLFALYSESLQPNNGSLRDAFNNPFDPRFGEGTEYGVKFDVLNNRVSGTVSFWDIDQTNRVIFDVNAPNPNVASGLGANVARGLNTSRGWEADVFISWTNGLQSMLSYAHTKVTTSGDVNPLVNGAREFGSYAHGFGAVTSYRFSEGQFKGMTVGLGLNYTSETIATGRETFNGNRQRTTPSAWDGNAFIGYRTRLFERDCRFQLNVNNLFERDFFAGWDPSRPNDLGVADQPFAYPTERKFTFTTAVEF